MGGEAVAIIADGALGDAESPCHLGKGEEFQAGAPSQKS